MAARVYLLISTCWNKGPERARSDQVNSDRGAGGATAPAAGPRGLRRCCTAMQKALVCMIVWGVYVKSQGWGAVSRLGLRHQGGDQILSGEIWVVISQPSSLGCTCARALWNGCACGHVAMWEWCNSQATAAGRSHTASRDRCCLSVRQWHGLIQYQLPRCGAAGRLVSSPWRTCRWLFRMPNLDEASPVET